VWAAQQAYEDARTVHEQASLREQATRELMRLAARAVAEAERRDQALDVLAELTDARLVTLATPGTALWLLPDYDRDGFKGFGRVGTSLGMTCADGLVVIKSEGHDQPHNWLRLNPVAVLTVAEARARWWITDAAGANLVSGGAADHDRMVRLRDEKYAGCQVQRGDEFIAEGAGHVLAL
jgi:hypothetical protein